MSYRLCLFVVSFDSLDLLIAILWTWVAVGSRQSGRLARLVTSALDPHLTEAVHDVAHNAR
jgi:hypothetical protein